VNDTRLRIAMALADDARTICVDFDDELVQLPESHWIAQARQHFNEAITLLNKAYTPEPDGDDVA
jgi:hypothetical protein